MLPERLLLRGKSYYFRVVVPKDLRAVFGKREVKVSLGTSDSAEAKKLVRQMSADFDRQVDAYRAILQSPTQLTDLAPDQIRKMVAEWRDGELDAVHASEIPDDPVEAVREVEHDLGSMEAFDQDARTSVSDRAVRILLENGVRLETRKMSRRTAELTKLPYRVPKPAVESDQFTVLVKAIRAAIFDILVAERNEALGRATRAPASPASASYVAPAATDYPDVTLAELKEHFDKSSKRAQKLKGGVKDKHKVTWRVLEEVLGKDKLVASLTRKDFEAVFEIVKAMPPKVDAKFPRKTLVEAVKAAKKQGLAPMMPRTINGYMDAMSRLLRHASQAGMRAPLDITDLRVDVSNWTKDQRQPFSLEQLNSMFGSYLYLEGAPRLSAHPTYDLAPKDSYRFWLPLIGLFSGMRIGEIAQLLVSDVETIGEVLCFHVQLPEDNAPPEHHKRLKNPSAERIVPVHPELLAIGFSSFVADRRKSGEARLFSDVRIGSDETFSQIPSQWFARFLPKVIEKTPQYTFHSFRHAFRDATREARLDQDTVSSLMGWSKSGKSMSFHYGAGLKAKSLAEELGKVRYEGLDLSHLYQSGP